MHEFLTELKARLLARQSRFLKKDEWCGDTETGFHTETEFDMQAMFKEMDAFGEEVRQRAERLGLK